VSELWEVTFKSPISCIEVKDSSVIVDGAVVTIDSPRYGIWKVVSAEIDETTVYVALSK
jgi:hypothetical protein